MPSLPMLVPALDGGLTGHFISNQDFLVAVMAGLVVTFTLRTTWRRMGPTWFMSEFHLLFSIADIVVSKNHGGGRSGSAVVVVGRWRLSFEGISMNKKSVEYQRV